MLEPQPTATTARPPDFSTARHYTDTEHGTWGDVVRTQRPLRATQLVPMFERGLAQLDMDRDTIPSLDAVNAKLRSLTGWQGVFVKGLEDGNGFYRLLRDKKFPVGNFVRDRRDLNYTPEPDIIHDLYGHIPFHADQAYADYCQRYGEFACKYLDDATRLRKLERFFWFTNEFALVETPAGRRIFGAGIASSVGECVHSLGNDVEVLPFDVQTICAQEFRIDQMQRRLFVMKSVEQLYQSFDALQACVRA
jgi:phenylalanine-4-hydroxylase